MITYENQNGKIVNKTRHWNIDVRLDGRLIGEIISAATGFYYKPKGSKPGDTFPTVAAVKRSLEGDE